MSRKFIFVSGCPRSGTTVLTQLLNWGEDVFIGQERFAGLFNQRPADFQPALFAEGRLSTFEPGDCGYKAFADKAPHVAPFARKKDFNALGKYTFVGDKITHMDANLAVFDNDAWKAEAVTVLHVVRDLPDVMASYASRKADAADSNWSRGVADALDDWQESIRRMHHFCERQQESIRIGIVDYEAAFGGDAETLAGAARNIFSFAGIPFGPEQSRGMAILHKSIASRSLLRQQRPRVEFQEMAIDQDVADKHMQLLRRSIC